VRAESGVEAENESLKTIQKQVKIRTFSAPTAEKIRHPASFNRAWDHSGAARKDLPPASLRCRAEGLAIRQRQCVCENHSHRSPVKPPSVGRKDAPRALWL
jgi:hypothetical protein